MDLVLSIDLGTTGVRAAVYDPSGVMLSSAYSKLGMEVSEAGWISQNPEEMFNTSLALANKVGKEFSRGIQQAHAPGADDSRSVSWSLRTTGIFESIPVAGAQDPEVWCLY